MTTFDEMHFLDLHGNSLKKERCPDGSKDVNVFDIKQGVAIALFIKKRGKKKEIFHADLWGEREKKYSWLQENDINTTEWKSVTPKSEYYLFIPRDENISGNYDNFIKVPDIFPVNSVGIVTARDEFVIDIDKNKVRLRILQFRDNNVSDEIIQQTYHLKDKSNWTTAQARAKIRQAGNWEQYFVKVLYRPFDARWIYFHDAIIERSRTEVMQHMKQGDNLGLMTLRKGLPNYQYSWVFVSDDLVSHGVYYNGNQSTEYLFPLYLYSSKEKKGLFHAEGETREPNIKPEILKSLTKAYEKDISPEEIFYYIYAVLYSEIYRTKYAEMLNMDFPRVPFTKAYQLFKKMSEYGNRLVNLHLLKSQELDSPIARFQVAGGNKVEKPKYDDNAGRAYVNKEQYFEGISGEVWNYQIGGYQVCDKWLKDRKDRVLSLDEIQTYCRIVTAIHHTISIQSEIDELYTKIELNPIVF
jgi:predicted helicase